MSLAHYKFKKSFYKKFFEFLVSKALIYLLSKTVLGSKLRNFKHGEGYFVGHRKEYEINKEWKSYGIWQVKAVKKAWSSS